MTTVAVATMVMITTVGDQLSRLSKQLTTAAMGLMPIVGRATVEILSIVAAATITIMVTVGLQLLS